MHECKGYEDPELKLTDPHWLGTYGAAIDVCRELEDGRLMVTNREYSTQVNYCPWCGYEAKVKVGKEKGIIS